MVNEFFCAGLLTKKFVSLIKHADDGSLDLNKAAEVLKVWIEVFQEWLSFSRLVHWRPYFGCSIIAHI